MLFSFRYTKIEIKCGLKKFYSFKSYLLKCFSIDVNSDGCRKPFEGKGCLDREYSNQLL